MSAQAADRVGDIWFRAEEQFIDDGSESYAGVEIVILEWEVTKATRSGVWLRCITQHWRKKRFALSQGSRAVRRTEAEAINSLIARKRRQVQIVEYQRQVALDTIEVATQRAEAIKAAGGAA